MQSLCWFLLECITIPKIILLIWFASIQNCLTKKLRQSQKWCPCNSNSNLKNNTSDVITSLSLFFHFQYLRDFLREGCLCGPLFISYTSIKTIYLKLIYVGQYYYVAPIPISFNFCNLLVIFYDLRCCPTYVNIPHFI